jgi:hypothetical protein
MVEASFESDIVICAEVHSIKDIAIIDYRLQYGYNAIVTIFSIGYPVKFPCSCWDKL